MCGIFGIVTRDEQALGPILIEAGRRLSYRGYDTVGCAVIDASGCIDLRKDVGKIDAVSERLNFAGMVGKRGILQLRWATFGAPSQVNAQPHIDSDGDLVGAHNGNVVNNVELRRRFTEEGMTVRSENDGESCVHAVERYINRGMGFIDAIRCAYNDLQGDYAFVIGRDCESELYAIKKGSGLVVGIGDGFTCIASDLPSLLPLTRRIVRVHDGEIVTLSAEGVRLHRVSDGMAVERAPETVTETMESARKAGYAHFMLKEIYEQPGVAREMLHLLENSTEIDRLVETLTSARNIFLIGCGTSYHACLLGSVYLAQMAGRITIPVLAPQFIAQYAPAVGPNDVGLFVSQSGETKDVLNAVAAAQAQGMSVLGMVNVVGSTLERVSSYHIPLACGYEISVPATKTFMNQGVAFLYLALRLSGKPVAALTEQLPLWMQQTLEEVAPQVQSLVDGLANEDDLYCLGYGLTYPIALEAALKLKEITYAHCEGMLSTEFKHGPLAAVDEGYPVIFVAGSQDIDLIISGINEVTCRGGAAIVIGPDDERLRINAEQLITIPPADPATMALLSVLPLQLLSYHLSLARGYDPDFPRNLSKTLTVD